MSILSTALSMSYHYPDAPIEDSTLLSLDQEADYQQIWTLEWFWGLNKGELPLCTSLNRLQLRADVLKEFLDVNWVLIPTKEVIEAIETMSIHNNYADTASRKVFTKVLAQPEYEYELKPVGFHLESRRSTLYTTVNGTRRAYHYPYDDVPRIRSCAHPFFVLLHARDYTFDRPPCGTFNRVRDLTNVVVNITKYWMRAPPTHFIYGPDIAIEHRHPHSIAGSVAPKPKKPKTQGRSKDRLKPPKTKQGPRAREDRLKKARPRAIDPPGTASISDQPVPSQSGSSLGKRKRGSDIAQHSAASSSRLSSHAIAAISADNLYTSDEIRVWMCQGAPAYDGGRCTTPDPPPDVAAALAQYTKEPSRDPEETLRAGKRFKRGIVPLMQIPDTSRFCSNDWAHEKFRVHLWALYDPQNIIHL